LSNALSIGVLWCTHFQSRGFLKTPLRLRSAYRPPSLFASKMRDAGHNVEFLVCDEMLGVADFNGATRSLQDRAQILYLMTHGHFIGSGYDVYLHSTNWSPGATGIGRAKLAVAIFDTCELIDSKSLVSWQSIWSRASFGVQLRLMLGFDGPAVIDEASALRASAFAENLVNGSTFADSWITAVAKTCGHSQFRKAVAIGIGDTMPGAQAVLNSASLASMPGARGGGSVYFEERY
jgi:hypothetical protein